MSRRFHLVFLVIFTLSWSIFPLLADTAQLHTTPHPEGDDFSPGLGIFAAIMLVIIIGVSLLLLGIGIVAGIAVCVLAGTLVTLGILSSSTAVGLIRRSTASGFRALFLQLGAVAGIPCGIACAWLGSLLWHWNGSMTALLLIGGTIGLGCGFLVAWLFNLVWTKIGGAISTKLKDPALSDSANPPNF